MGVNWFSYISLGKKQTKWTLLFLSILPVFIITISILFWYIKPLPDEVFLGFSQAEQPVYLVLSKKVAEEGSFIFYSSPYAIEEDFPRIYTHLLPLLIGYTWKLTGVPLLTLWWIIRVVFGPIMFLLAFKILSEYITDNNYLIPGAILLGFGGGLAYLHAFLGSLILGDDFVTGWMLLEAPYDWWFTNLFRVAYYPLEIFTHVLFFSSVYLFLRKKYTYSAVIFFLTWWAHPFTGALLTAIYMVFFVIEISLYKRDLIKAFLPFGGITLLFTVYYLFWIPSIPLAKELMTSFRISSSPKHISLLLYPSAWGIFLFLPMLNRRNIFKEDKTRFLLYWIVVNLILINHDLLIKPGFQPMHFTRGYLFVPLCILSILGLSRFFRANNTTLILIVLIILSLPDNALFVYKFATLGGDDAELEYILTDDAESLPTYHTNPLRIRESQWDVLQKLKREEKKQVLVSGDNIINFLIPLYTDHKTLLGHPEYVPHFNEKRDTTVAYFKTMDAEKLKSYGVTMVIYPKRRGKNLDTIKIIYENSDYALIEVE